MNMNTNTNTTNTNTSTDAPADAPPTPVATFDEMGLNDELLHGLYSYGFEAPSRIQTLAIVPMAQNRDLVAQSQSGTGKTGAFVLGSLQQALAAPSKASARRGPQVIIVTPTRDLALQIGNVVSDLGSYADVTPVVCIGGTRRDDNIADLRGAVRAGGVVVAVGTPGRILDLMGRGALVTDSVIRLVVDEADEMLSYGFVDQLYDVVQGIPSDTAIALFSATIDKSVLDLSTRFLRDPIVLTIPAEDVTLDGIQQFYVTLDDDWMKLPTLLDLYESISVQCTIIFCNSRDKVERLAQALEEEDHTVSFIHSDMSIPERTAILDAFSRGESRILISTDLLARGIDVQTVSLVINFDMTRKNIENYVHRIGRGGRFGRRGVAISFLLPADEREVQHLNATYDNAIQPLPANVSALFD